MDDLLRVLVDFLRVDDLLRVLVDFLRVDDLLRVLVDFLRVVRFLVERRVRRFLGRSSFLRKLRSEALVRMSTANKKIAIKAMRCPVAVFVFKCERYSSNL